MSGGLKQLAEMMLRHPERFLRKGTRPIPFSKAQLVEDAQKMGVTIRGAKPLGTGAESEIIFQTLSPSKLDDNLMVPVSYRLRKFAPDHLAEAFDADTLDHTFDLNTLEPSWMEHFVRQAPEQRRFGVLNALASGDAKEGTGSLLYPLTMDYQLLDPHTVNLVTGLTKDNINRWPANQIPQYLRSGGMWAEKSIPPMDLFADPVAESMKDPAGRLESLLNLHLVGGLNRMHDSKLGSVLEDMVVSDAVSPLEAAMAARSAGVGQVGERTIRQLRGLQSAVDGRESDMIHNLKENFRKGGAVSVLASQARRSCMR